VQLPPRHPCAELGGGGSEWVVRACLCVSQTALGLFGSEVASAREQSKPANNSWVAESLFTSPVVFLSKRCQVQPGHVLVVRVRTSNLSAADPHRVTSDGRLLNLHPERLHNHESRGKEKERSTTMTSPVNIRFKLSCTLPQPGPAPREGAAPDWLNPWSKHPPICL